MKLDEFLLALVVFSIVITAGVFIISDVNTHYDTDISTSEYNDTYTQIDQVYNISEAQKSHVLDSDISTDSSWESMLTGGYSAIRMVGNVFGVFKAILMDLSEQLNIPSYFIVFVITAMTILITFAIIYLVFRFKPLD